MVSRIQSEDDHRLMMHLDQWIALMPRSDTPSNIPISSTTYLLNMYDAANDSSWLDQMCQLQPALTNWWKRIDRAIRPVLFDENSEMSSSYEALLMLPPLLEHLLRRLWVQANQLDPMRCCTADSREQYCILDDIFSRQVSIAGQTTDIPQENQLRFVLYADSLVCIQIQTCQIILPKSMCRIS
jgi:hypothetical protein